MNWGRILVVEDDNDISMMLRLYFSQQGYRVETAARGDEALELAREVQPHLIILDINLPDMNGFDVCHALRTRVGTSHIPIIFLTEKNERDDKIAGLETGADDYMTKPFDIEELTLKISNIISSAQRQSSIDPKSNLPTGHLLEDALRRLLQNEKPWAYLDIRISQFDPFTDVYGWSAGDEVIRYTARMLMDTLTAEGTFEDYLGHPGQDHFVVVTFVDDPYSLVEQLERQFIRDVQQHYTFIDRERGYMLLAVRDQTMQVQMMSLAVGMVSTRTHQFADIREITEKAAENRRYAIDFGGEAVGRGDENDVLTQW